jgi:hypothetical protein
MPELIRYPYLSLQNAIVYAEPAVNEREIRGRFEEDAATNSII